MLWLSLRVAGLTTLISLLAGGWLGYVLRARRGALWATGWPLVLPPTIICAWLLAPQFTWPVAVAAGCVFAVPLVACATAAAFRGLAPCYENAARTLGASDWRIFWRVSLPLAWRPIAAAAALAFARVSTEFLAALWIAGRVRP